MLKNSIRLAINKFNFKPKLGLKILTELKVIHEDNAEDIARFIKETKGLNKDKIGEFFGKEKALNIECLSVFTDLMDFTGLTIDSGLKKYL